jgi:hypothetical protein
VNIAAAISSVKNINVAFTVPVSVIRCAPTAVTSRNVASFKTGLPVLIAPTLHLHSPAVHDNSTPEVEPQPSFSIA